MVKPTKSFAERSPLHGRAQDEHNGWKFRSYLCLFQGSLEFAWMRTGMRRGWVLFSWLKKDREWVFGVLFPPLFLFLSWLHSPSYHYVLLVWCVLGGWFPPLHLVFCILAAWAHVHVLVSVSSERVSCPVDGLRAGLAQPMPSWICFSLLQPGDVWTLPDQCHTVTCLPDGQTLLKSHRVNCDRGPRPSCPNGQPPLRVEETCGCRWTCPCKSIASPVWTVL